MTEHHSTNTTPRVAQLLAGALLGSLPGLLLILIAQFVITGEPQLTVGTAGMWLAAAGATMGLILAVRRTRRYLLDR